MDGLTDQPTNQPTNGRTDRQLRLLELLRAAKKREKLTQKELGYLGHAIAGHAGSALYSRSCSRQDNQPALPEVQGGQARGDGGRPDGLPAGAGLCLVIYPTVHLHMASAFLMKSLLAGLPPAQPPATQMTASRL